MRKLSSTADILKDRALLGVITVSTALSLRLVPRDRPHMQVWLVFGAIADVIIAVTMTLLVSYPVSERSA